MRKCRSRTMEHARGKEMNEWRWFVLHGRPSFQLVLCLSAHFLQVLQHLWREENGRLCLVLFVVGFEDELQLPPGENAP